MRRGLTLIAFAVASISLSAWVLIERQGAEGDENLAAKVERVMKEEAAKARFTGEIGDFVVLPLEAQGSPESRIIACGNGAASTPVEREGTTLRAEELWSPAFDVPEGVGWSCPGEGVVLVNNQGMHGETSSGDLAAKIRGYVRSVPVKIVRDAPRDRLELVMVEGHPGLLEHPIEGYPYGLANLVVIERYPDGDTLGIVVLVEHARSADEALKIAEEIMP